MKIIITNNEKETVNLGRQLGNNCHGGEIFAVLGNLGSGKTKLTQGLARGLGIKSKITSPTFNIFRVYKVNKKGNIKKFYHVDAYRLKSEKDLINLGVQEFLGRKDSVVIIEWAERVKKIFPKRIKTIKIRYKAEKQREILIK